MTTYLSDYQTFASTQELNYNVSMHEQTHRKELNATNRTVLRFIARYSVKYSGASHLKVATIAEGTGKSERTIHRNLSRLEGLGIIKKITQIRPKSGGQGASIIVIEPYLAERMADRQVDEKARSSKGNRRNSGKQPLRKQFTTNYVLEADELFDNARNKNNIPVALYDMLSPFFQGKELRKYVGIVFRAKTAKTRIESHVDDFKACITDCIRRYKQGYIRSLESYLYTSIRKLSRRLYLI